MKTKYCYIKKDPSRTRQVTIEGEPFIEEELDGIKYIVFERKELARLMRYLRRKK